MKKAVVILAVVLMMALPGTALGVTPEWEIHKGATALTWLTNPANAKYGTKLSRSRVHAREQVRLIHGFRRAGWWDSAWCVHLREGYWDDTRNPVDDGGMQMDQGFQGSYGPQFVRRWGRAYNWPWWAQMYTAYRGWQARGWAPWPNTARACGLI